MRASPKTVWEILKQTASDWSDDNAARLSASLAYYAVLSIAPLLVLAVSVAGLVFGEDAARGQIASELSGVVGPQAGEGIQTLLIHAKEPEDGLFGSIVGVVVLMFGASGVFGQLKDALNTIWNVEPKKAAGIKGFIKQRFLSMAMVLGIGFLLLITLVFDAMLSAMGDYVGRYVGGEAVLHAIQLVISFALATVLFAAIFRILPDLKIAWRDVWLGAVITSLLFVLGKFALGLYLGKAAVGSSYGAAGSLVVLLVWVYWSAQILFLGAEFTQVYARNFGSLKGDTSKREARAQAARPEDRPRAKESGAAGLQPAVAPAYAKQKTSGGGGLIKVAAGGLAGLLFGAILGGISAVVMVLKTARKMLIPFK